MEIVTNVNANPVSASNEPDHVQEQKAPQVRKISRFQVSHVQEEEKLTRLNSVVHGTDILPEQPNQTQLVHELVTHAIQSPIDAGSSEAVESMVC